MVDPQKALAWLPLVLACIAGTVAITETRLVAADNKKKIEQFDRDAKTSREERQRNREAQIRYEANQNAIKDALQSQQRALEALTRELRDRQR